MNGLNLSSIGSKIGYSEEDLRMIKLRLGAASELRLLVVYSGVGGRLVAAEVADNILKMRTLI